MLALGVEVDLLHAASMLGLGLVDRRRRGATLTDAAIAGSFALAGAFAARAAGRPRAAPATPHGLDRLRDQCADRLARLLVPGYPATARPDSTGPLRTTSKRQGKR